MIIAITGHRPEDCEAEDVVRRKFRNALDPSRVSVLICGMAAGVDLWAAHEAKLLGIEIWAARPWAGHTPRKGDEQLYAEILEYASKVVNVDASETYAGPWVYHNRNHWMVDHATDVYCYWNGKEKGGTFECRKYAIKKNVPVHNVY